MAITASINGTPIASDIIFTEMSPFIPNVKTLTHAVDGANYDIVIPTGQKSPVVTLKGYFKRTSANIAEFKKMLNGNKITITHSIEGTHTGIVTSPGVSVSGGGLYVVFSLTVVEQ